MQTINLGTTANDGTGDDLRTAGQKINENFLSPHFGCWIYQSSFVPQVGSSLLLENDGTGTETNTTFKLPAIDDIWDVTENEFDFSGLELGDKVCIAFDLDIETTVINQEVRCIQILSYSEPNEKSLLYSGSMKLSTESNIQQRFNIEFIIDTEDVRTQISKIGFISNDDCSVFIEKMTVFAHKRTP
jgi:hypothetical protein